MKNILGTQENLEFFNKEGKLVYGYCKDSNGHSRETTYNIRGHELSYKDSDGNSRETTYNSRGNELTYKNSNGYSCETTYNSIGNELTYKNSNGESRSFDIPEYTMEELVNKLGNFKIKK